MSTVLMDPERFPNLTGVERPFYEYWSSHVLSDADPHRDRWIDYEEGAVARARERNDLVRSVTPLDGLRVLDVGCQNGAWLIALAQDGAIPVGIDVVPSAVDAAVIRAECYGLDVDVQVASACEMPFPTADFDVVACSDVLEHVPDKVAMLHECVRVLRPGGYLFLRAPIRFSVKHLLRDPHYGLPGISVLPGRAAGWIATTLFDEPVYEVETLPTKAWTTRRLRRFGMEPVDGTDEGRRLRGLGPLDPVVDELRQEFTIIARKLDRS